jgi:hypothetical protein
MKMSVVVLFVLVGAAVANATFIGIYNVNCYGTRVNVPLETGIYEFTLVSPEVDSRATFYAWNYIRNQPCTWNTPYQVIGDSLVLSGGFGAWSQGYTDRDAWRNTVVKVGIVNVPFTQTVGLQISDSIYSDNAGGVSVMINQVPEPATLLLLGLGGIILRKRKH